MGHRIIERVVDVFEELTIRLNRVMDIVIFCEVFKLGLG